jgi:Holliday junction resolvase-like predicted endonuclease
VINRGWQLDLYRNKINKVEIDLQFSNQQKQLFIEVKFLDNEWRAFERIHSSQLLRLRRVLNEARFKNSKLEIQFFIAFVDRYSKIKFVSIDEI